uniref:4Fe-4S single cluster domain protein n=1 Tax=Siphoviridae sp. ctmqu18 TaxID=2825655 RepID=A0A8S5V6H8_9CAUD|nr:MAG TPA: 4Fe-4S single cluster domain protein [Siphoviridae sp. ctmqu18]
MCADVCPLECIAIVYSPPGGDSLPPSRPWGVW